MEVWAEGAVSPATWVVGAAHWPADASIASSFGKEQMLTFGPLAPRATLHLCG